MSNIHSDNFCPTNREDWRKWLEQNHISKESIWLIYYKSSSENFNLSWTDAVEEALCFGWIDSVRKSIDEERFIQFFSKRKKNSTWSKINKQKIELLIEKNLMSKAGLDCIAIAKQNGSWIILDTVEALIIPDDLKAEFIKHPGAKEYFESLSKSRQKIQLSWIVLAKRAETRQKRIVEIAENAQQKLLPKQFR
ncbi:YdeI/OmpD-associated family protein [Algoriphagus aquimarinus]|uniref:Uncharacterized conserved protein YdeI, YjbR/CyaY-like superfamily, DUF1801 family n=1 Tax=Algoriphagus aquimarinus TaxID=237018 RepID=A0A1I1A2R4_9BACT|nr:YdeI/OmpD-associated family protein [Algoriphagus aquimarinus]SFB31596.1 Uncharacterized conserved protein YdeI, YjbR/CyaY-like superfamily, DUF1801 family [Algoriphagus aquimarinus]